MVSVRNVAVTFSLAAACASGRSLRAEPWEGVKDEGVTDYMAAYTAGVTGSSSDTESAVAAPASPSADSRPTEPDSTKSSAGGVVAWTPSSSPDSWLKAPVGDDLSVDAQPQRQSTSMNSWLKAPVDDSSSPVSGSIPWLKQATDSWAFAVPHAVPDAADSAPPADVSPSSETAEQPVASTDVERPPHDADTLATSPWDSAPRSAVQREDVQRRTDSVASDQGQARGQDNEQRDDTADDSSRDSRSDAAAVHVHASGSIGGLFDGGEDRGAHGSDQGASHANAKADAPSHAGGAVVDVRLDSELQEARR